MIAVTTDILAAIDGAVRDWETSADAMRWVPGAPEETSGDVGMSPVEWIRRYFGSAGHVTSPGPFATGGVIGRRDADLIPVMLSPGAAYVRSEDGEIGTIDPCTINITFAASEFSEACDQAAFALRNLSITVTAPIKPRDSFHMLHLFGRERPWWRCPVCHPDGNPGPMLGVKPSLPRGRRHRRRR